MITQHLFQFRTKFVMGCIIFIIMVPILFCPLGVDQVFFLQGGQVIAQGGKIYADYVDTKSPLMYYMFAGVYSLVGGSVWSIRGFELLWQLLTIFLLIRLVRDYLKNDTIAFSAGILYALLYPAAGYPLTLEGETLVAPLFILLIIIQLRQNPSKSLMVWRGVILAAIIGCKYTFGIVLGGIFILDVFSSEISRKQVVLRYSLTLLGFVIGSMVLFSPLLDPAIASGYKDVWNFTKSYSNIPPFGPGLAEYILKSIARYFAGRYSLLVLATAFIGQMLLLYSARRDDVTSKRIVRLLTLCVMLLMVLLISIVIERKCIYYHFSRLYVPLTILSGAGIGVVYYWLTQRWKNFHSARKGLVLGLFCITILFSPIMRWLKIAPLPLYYVMSKEQYLAALISISDPEYFPLTPSAIRDYLHSSETPAKRAFVMGLHANLVSYSLQQTPVCKINSTACYFGIGSPQSWKDEMWKEVQQAGWLVIENNDKGYIINGHNLTTWESVQKDSLLYSYLHDHFDSTTAIGGYYLYRRK